MEFNYSYELPAIDNTTGGLAGDIPVRRHKNPYKETIGARRAQGDWVKYVGALTGFQGSLSWKYGLMQVAVPECRPERLELIAYASEIGFLYDDCTEFLNQDEISKANDSMQSAFSEGVQKGVITSGNGGIKAMQSILLNEMIAIDKPRALVAMKVWIEFLQEAAGRRHNSTYTSFGDYMQYRVLDVGEMFWFGLVTFGMGLTIPASELPIIRTRSRSCWIVLALQNDICSYEKEIQAARRQGVSHVVNALEVLMREDNVDLEGAKALCKEHIKTNVSVFQHIVSDSQNDPKLSKDSKAYLESLLYTISGDAAWSLTCPRYNPDQMC